MLRTVAVAVIMAMMMIMRMAVMMVMVPVRMAVAIIVVMVMDTLRRTSALHLLAEYQRLDGDRHGIGRHADAAEVDVIEVAQQHTIDAEDLALDQEFLAQDRTQRLR